MTTTTSPTSENPPLSKETQAVVWISILFIGLGLAVFLYLLTWVSANPDFSLAWETRDMSRITLIFLTEFGIIRPVLLFLTGVYVIRMGIQLFQREKMASLSAQQLLMWLGIASVFGLLLSIRNSGQMAGGILIAIIPWAFLITIIVFTRRWLQSKEDLFIGQETLTARNGRMAWNLLIPTIAVLIIVALQPLEQTFISSLTNDEFATNIDVEFIGFDNYSRLLGLRFDTVPCERAGGSCVKDEDGNNVFPRSRRYLMDSIENYAEWDYRPLNEITLGGTQYVISARDRDFMNAIKDTLVFTVSSVVLELILGLFIAMVVNSKFPGRGLMRTAMLVPWAIPTVVSARLWELMLADRQSGVINSILINLGIIERSQAWLTSAKLQVPAMVMVDVWKTTPFMALLLLAGLQVIPKDVYEAADVDGASKVRQFFSITIPLLRPAIAVALVFRTLDAIRVFDLFQVLLGGNRFSLATYNYEMLVTNNDLGYASAVGVTIFVIILLFTMAYVRVLGVER